MGGFSYPLVVAAHQAHGLAPEVRGLLVLASVAFMSIGQTSLAGFTRMVFRPRSAWAGWTVAAVAAAFVASLVGQYVDPGYTAIALEQELPWLLYRFATVFVLAWTGFESLLYARVSWKRQRVGLADAVVTNRFLLWAFSTLSSGLLALVTGIVSPELSGSMAAVMVTTPIVLAASISLWIAFLPPRFYLRWLGQQPA
jgi:hypothetical protein